MSDQYQTLLMSDGTIRQGIFPTIDWFNEIKKHVDFQGKVVLDLGCNSFSYGIQAIRSGAKFVVGIDNDQNRISESRAAILDHEIITTEKTAIRLAKIEDFQPFPYVYDVTIFSMILHWLEDAPKQIQRYTDATKETVIFVYRYRQPDLKEEGYHPTLEELNAVVNLTPIHHSMLSTTKEQNIGLTIYAKNLRA